MAAGDIVQCVIVGKLHGQQTNNVLHFKANNALVTPASIIADILDCLRTTLFPSVSSDFVLDSIRGKVVYPAASDEIITPGETTDHGSLGAALPSFNAALISVRTGLGGRSKRGRIFLPGAPEAGQADSKMSTGELALVVAFAACLATKFIGGLGLGGANMGVLSRKLKVTHPTDPSLWFFPAAELLVAPYFATMHSRKVGVGI